MASAGSVRQARHRRRWSIAPPDARRLILLCVAATALLMGLLGLLLSSGDISPGALLLLVGIGGFIGLLIGVGIDGNRTLLYRTTSSKSRDAIRDVVVRLFASNGWALSGETADTIWYSRTLRPNLAVAVFLALLGVIPAIIYVVLSRRRQTAAVRWTPDGNGYLVEVEISYQGHGGRTAANWIMQQV